MWSNITFYPMKRLHTDNEGEYVMSELQFFLRKQGVIYKTNILHVHQQNGYAEQLNCILLKKAQSIWLEACIPDFWWKFVIAAAAHIYNHTSVRHLKWKTP